jgi:hypothetical protein
VSEKERGNVHGRVDHASLRTSIKALVQILQQLGHAEEVRNWESRLAQTCYSLTTRADNETPLMPFRTFGDEPQTGAFHGSQNAVAQGQLPIK